MLKKHQGVICILTFISLMGTLSGCDLKDKFRAKVFPNEDKNLVFTQNIDADKELIDIMEFSPEDNANFVIPSKVTVKKTYNIEDVIADIINKNPKYFKSDLKVLDFENNSGTVTLNMSEEFLDNDINANGLRIYSIVNTLCYGEFKAKAVEFLVNNEQLKYDGKPLDCTLYVANNNMLDPNVGLGDGKMPSVDLSADTEDVSDRKEDDSDVDHDSKNPEIPKSDTPSSH